MNQLLVTIGGSHRKYKRQCEAFRAAGIELHFCGRFTLGSKLNSAVMPDTEQARALLKSVGGSIARKQWSHLSED